MSGQDTGGPTLRELADRARERLRPRRGEAVPFSGLDVSGMPTDLATWEEISLRRSSPRRAPWPAVREFDDRAAQLEQRQVDVGTDLAALHSRLLAAPADDANRIAAWQLDGQRGNRPEPQAEAIEAEIRQRQADHDGLTAAVASVLARKAEFIERNRAKLAKEANKLAEAEHARLLGLIDEMASARRALADHRQAAVWAATFGSAEANRQPQDALAGGGQAQPARDALGVSTQVPVEGLWRLLRADAEWLRDAATPEQHALMLGRGEADQRAGGATWAGSQEAVEEDRREKREAIERYRREWGRDPV